MRLIVDTNVLLRLLGSEEGPHGDAARARVRSARESREALTVLSATVVETAFVLASPATGYGWNREGVAAAVESVLDESAFEIEHANALRTAAVSYRARSIDLHDCLLDALADQRGTKVLSFDDDLRKLGHRELP